MQHPSRKNRMKWLPYSLLACSLGLCACVYNPSSPNVYPAYQAQREAVVSVATVESVRPVKISANDGQPSGLGAFGGGALGAVVGGVIGRGRGSVVTSIIGGIAGAIAGNAIENGVSIHDGLEITVRLDNGDLRAITQDANGGMFAAGERVQLLSADGVTRVAPLAVPFAGS